MALRGVLGVWRDLFALTSVAAHSDRHTGAGGDQLEWLQGCAHGQEVIVAHGIDDGDLHPFDLERTNAVGDGTGPSAHGSPIDQTHPAMGLRLQHPYQVGIRHRRERVMAHARVGQKHIADEEMAFEDGSSVLGKGRACNGEVGTKCIHERVGHRTDVSLGRGIEGGTVLEVNLRCALGLQPAQGRKGLVHGLLRRNGAGLECHHHGVNRSIDPGEGLRGHPEGLNHS